ncbi:MAG: amidohydrolase family protein, partial [Candidatus Aenigmarchaeota archaeon]|nr:amidohydrolase family protein [Candidatus Aenigmarchaeota archaeon]
EQVRKKVREVLRAGADVIKVHTTGGVLSPTDHPKYAQFSPEELQVIVNEGRFRNGIKVMAHAQGDEGIMNAIAAGVHSIEHGIFASYDTLLAMADNNVFLVPTLIAVIAVIEQGAKGKMPEHAVMKAKEVVDVHKQTIANAHENGVAIAFGTDAGVFPHGENLRELGLLCDIGMTPMEAITAATHTAAACLGWEGTLGTIEAGKLADIIICKGNPLQDIRILENPENIPLVMLDGKVVKDTR